MRYWGTDIDGVSLEPEQLNVRGKSLNDIVSRYSYTGAIYHLLAGRDASSDEERALDDYLTQSLLSLDPDHVVIQVAQLTAKSGAAVSRAMTAGLMAESASDAAKLTTEENREAVGLDRDCLEGLYYFGLMPCLLAYVVAAQADEKTGTVARSVENLRARPTDYLSSVFRIICGRKFESERDRKVFNSIMISFHAGFGFLTPTVMLPRGAIGTAVPIVQAIAAGFAAAGPAHVGACEQAMELFHQIAENSESGAEAAVNSALDDLSLRGALVPGFGHPLFKEDPRNAQLRRLLESSGFESAFVRIYDLVAARLRDRLGINPNIDSISAAVFLSLGVDSAYGTGLFLCSRSSAMVAHILEKKRKPAFGARSQDVRQWLQSLPTSDGEFAMIQ